MKRRQNLVLLQEAIGVFQLCCWSLTPPTHCHRARFTQALLPERLHTGLTGTLYNRTSSNADQVSLARPTTFPVVHLSCPSVEVALCFPGPPRPTAGVVAVILWVLWLVCLQQDRAQPSRKDPRIPHTTVQGPSLI